MKDIIFPTLNASDISQVCELEKLCFSSPWTETQFQLALEDKVFSIFGAKQGEKLIAYIAVYNANKNNYNKDGEIEVLNLAVHPDYRRQGVAKSLLTIVLQAALKMGIVKTVLEVRESNVAALALYRSLAFVQVGVRPKYYPDTNENALILACDINSDNI